jgi:hypothetical protein
MAARTRHSASCIRHFLLVLAVLSGGRYGLAASEHYGQVTFGGLPVPGAVITASQGEQRLVTTTDSQGVFRLAEPHDGVWTIKVEMLGFSTVSRDVSISANAPPSTWELNLLPFEEIVQGASVVSGAPPSAPAAPPTSGTMSAQAGQRARGSQNPGGGFQRAAVTASPRAPVVNDALANPPGEEPLADAADGLLINGSVNNGAASPFAQPAAFGNNRRRPGSLYNFGFGVIAGNSAWDARPFSFSGPQVAKPSYNDLHFVGTFGGPIRFSRAQRNVPNLFVGYQRTSDHNASTQSTLMPTLLERSGDFSETRDLLGRPVRVVDPITGRPFAGGVIPRDRISPQAAALLGYYPEPNLEARGRFNYQAPVIAGTRQDSIQARLTQLVNPRNQVFGTVAYQRTTTDTTNLFGFEDEGEVSAVDTSINWTHRFNQFFSLRPRYQFTRQTTTTTPFFANRTNVSGEAGIAGNDQMAVNWGPPTLTFASGVAGLTDARYAFTRTQTHTGSAEGYWSHGRHNLTFGGDIRRHHIDILSQQDPRGTLAFTGAFSGSDLADFLLGTPLTSSIASGNADKYLRASSYDAYLTDDLRLSPSLTINVGVRWEFESPIVEAFGRLVNLDVAPGFSAVSPVVPGNPIGPLTGLEYPASLMHSDKLGFQPRLATAWRPVPGSSLVIRAGYGIYRNTAVYQSMATFLAQQPPFSKTFSVESSAANPLTLANAFIAPTTTVSNTFAVDPDFRIGYTQNWQVSAQRDLPGSLTVTASYLGTKGSRLMQEFLPNTYPGGAVNPCPACSSGFIYLTSDGSSLRQAGQLQLRRRLRNGLLASVQYTLAKATDDAAAFSGAGLNGAVIAQDWLDLEAERGPSTFDQRHQVVAQFQYTTGVGVSGGTLLDGFKGTLFKGWTVTSQLIAGSGLPFTPVYLTSVIGTGVTGTLRPDLTGVPVDAVPAGYYLNPAAYTAPSPGRWGNAGRNSVRGPAQFGLNAGVSRTFPWGNRLNLEWRVDATNVLNRVTFASVNALVGSPQFGLANLANPMRKLQTTVRLRF